MSHFTVLVPVPEGRDLDTIMLPYHEYESTGIEQYIEWVADVPAEDKEAYFEKIREETTKNDAFSWRKNEADRQKDIQRYKALFEAEDWNAIADDWDGYKLGPDGSLGRFTNPNAKWDWYSIGGRWNGLLVLREGFKVGDGIAGKGRAGVMGTLDPDMSHADYAEKRAIDFDAMRKRQADGYIETHDKLIAVLDTLGYTSVNWNDGWYTDDRDKNREKYQEVRVKWQDMYGEDDWAPIMWKFKAHTRELAYQMALSEPLTYAMVDLEGNWHAKGEMGWWGIDSETDDLNRDSFGEAFWKEIDEAPDDTLFYVVDCHI
jgi:hypothetical protein